MAKINEAERKTQKHVLELFQNELNYVYYGDLRHQINSNIMVDKLTDWLTSPRGGRHSASLADRAISELQKVTGNLQQGLYKANQDVYSLRHKSQGEPR